MKSVLPSLLAAACALSRAAAQSTLDTAEAELMQIANLTANLTTTIRDWDGQPTAGLFEITQQNSNLVAYIGNATAQLRSEPTTFDTTESFDVGAPTQLLAYAVNASIAALIHQRAAFNASGLNSTVVLSLQQQLNASRDFSGVLLSYVPTDIRPVADALNQQIVDSLDMGVRCFSLSVDCNDAVANASRTYQAAVDSGAIPARSAAAPTTTTPARGGLAVLSLALAAAVWAL